MGRTVSNIPGYALDEDEFDPQIDDFVAKSREYLHFDLPLSERDREDFSANGQDFKSAPHWPLIGYITKERRLRREPNGLLSIKIKERPIKFASHRDAALLEFYARDLGQAYEKHIGSTGFASSILAYRSNIGNNIDHAKMLFDEIRLRGDCTAIAVDITSFFDRILHAHLRIEICKVRGCTRLNGVDHNVFRRMTRFDWVDSNEARDRLTYRYGRGHRICTGPEFRKFLREQKPSLIRTNTNAYGIPQGTPLSGLYANISLLSFDEEMTSAAQALGGSYRRYSDDIAIVIPTASGPALAIQELGDRLAKYGLELSASKTKHAVFSRNGSDLVATEPFQYLGFTFDGQRTLIRQSSLNRYYVKMHRGIRAKIHAAKRLGVASNEIYMRELFRKYTHFGQHRNFPRYVYRASEKHGAPEMKGQISRHMLIFRKMLDRAIADIY